MKSNLWFGRYSIFFNGPLHAFAPKSLSRRGQVIPRIGSNSHVGDEPRILNRFHHVDMNDLDRNPCESVVQDQKAKVRRVQLLAAPYPFVVDISAPQ